MSTWLSYWPTGGTRDEILGLDALVFWAIFLAAAVVRLGIHQHRKQELRRSSKALAAVTALNNDWSGRFIDVPPIKKVLRETARSKGALERYDLDGMLQGWLRQADAYLSPQIERHLEAQDIYREYERKFAAIGRALLGAQGLPRASPRLVEMESRMFEKTRLPAPPSRAEVRCVVTYRSPQGQNSYRIEKVWNFHQLYNNLAAVRRLQAQSQTTQFLRQQERNKMTTRLRAEVLTRDGSRCRMCGASPHDGAKLHVDHIVPVSKGGLTVLNNLQTLCQDCNLGKSNVL